jgi:peptide/nickel transport system substrate-binding protein
VLRAKGPKTWLLVLLTTLSLVAAGCGGEDEEGSTGTTVEKVAVEKGGNLTYAAEQGVRGFNINTSAHEGVALQWIVTNVYPQAFRALPDYSVVPDENLLERAEQTDDDPQTIVYEIKKEAVWSDGTPITAKDFEYRWKTSNGSNPQDTPDTTTGYEDIESVAGSGGDEKTVTVKFKKPFIEWRALFSNLLPAHLMPTIPGGPVEGLANPPTWSGGPFKITNYTEGQSLTLVPNEKWWGPKPNLDSIVVRLGMPGTAVAQALENNEIDMAYPQPQIDIIQQVKALPGIKAEINYGLQYEQLTFNYKNEFLAVKEVRQAIAWGLDRDEIVERTVKQFDDRGTRLDNRIWLTGQPEYEEHGEEYAEQDVDKAKDALEKAGFSEGADGVFTKDGKKLSMRIITTGGNALRESTEQLIQAQLKEVGIDIRIENKPGVDAFGEIDSGNFDIALFAWVGTPFTISSNKSIFAPGGEQNEGGYNNPRIAKLFEEATATVDREESVELTQEIDKVIWEDLATIPLFAKPTLLAYRDTFANFQDNATTEGPLWNAIEIGRKARA